MNTNQYCLLNGSFKDILYFSRFLDKKKQAYSCLYKTTDTSSAQYIQQNSSEQAFLDKLETKKIEYDYSKDSGQKQLLNTVDDAIDGLELIKNHSQNSLDELIKDRLELETRIMDFIAKFPKFGEKFMKALEKTATMIESNDDWLFCLIYKIIKSNFINSVLIDLCILQLFQYWYLSLCNARVGFWLVYSLITITF